MNCSLCNLCKYSEPSCIRGSGPAKAKIMIVNSYASELDEDKEIATIDPEVKQKLTSLGYKLNDIYYTNAIKCRVPKGTNIKASEVKKCKDYLINEINKVKPQYVLLLGAQSVQAALNTKITEVLGTSVEKDGVTYFSTYSPRVIYYDLKKAPQVEKDLKNFLSLYKGKDLAHKANINYKLITTMSQAKEALDDYMSNYTSVAYDIETKGLDRFNTPITLFGFGNKEVQYIVPLDCEYSPLQHKPIARAKIMKYILNRLNGIKVKIGQNVKFDNLFLRVHYGMSPLPTFDTMLASHILDENTPCGLKENAVYEFNAVNWDIDINLKKGKIVSESKFEEYCNYLAHDVYYTHKLYLRFNKKLKKDKALYNLYYHLVIRAAQKYEDVESNGVYIYQDKFNQVEAELKGRQKEIVEAMKNTLPEAIRNMDINWNSDKQIGALLYDTLKLPVIEKTNAGAPSTSESVLKRLSDKHPVVPLILDYRGVSIQISHFIDGWRKRMHDGRLYPKFKMLTVTGRTSCDDPNLQQVPRDKTIRSLIGAPPGWTLVEADYSQVELRIVAIVSEDRTMRRLFQTGVDIHTNTGMAVTGKSELSKEERKKAKAVNFGFVYGMSWKKFKDYARDNYGVSLTDKEAQEYRTRFFHTYSNLTNWHDKQRKLVRVMGQVRNVIGRIRRLPDIYSKDQSKRAEAERQAINSPVQGFGSDLTLMSMVEAMEYFPPSKAKCVGTVHDAQLWEVRDDYVKEFAPKLKSIMEEPKLLKEIFKFESPVPIISEVEVGDWGLGVELDEWLKNN